VGDVQADGLLGIGMTPVAPLDITSTASTLVGINSTNASGVAVAWKNSGTIFGFIGSAKAVVTGGLLNDFAINMGNSNNLIIAVNQAEAARFNSSGVLLLGETSSTPTGGGTYRLGIAGNIKFDSGGVIEWPTSGGNAWYLYDSSAALVFQRGGTEAARFDTSGNLCVGTTSGGGYKFNVTASSGYGALFSVSSGNISTIFTNTGSGGQTFTAFLVGATQTGSISSPSGTTTAYNTSSDYRLKENVQPMTGGLATVAALKPVTYDWISNGSAGEGFIAHELQAVIPEAVTGEKDAVDDKGKIKPQGVDFGKIVPHLVAAIQELTTRLAAMETK
jgi:hypothetical protein